MSEWERCRRCHVVLPVEGTYCDACFDMFAAEYRAEVQADYAAAGLPWPPPRETLPRAVDG